MKLTKAQYEARLRKIRHRIKITFESLKDREAVAPSLIGQTYFSGQVKSGLTKHQVAYRQKLAREMFSLPSGVGFAKQWRDGTSRIPVVREMQEQMMASVSAMLARELPVRRTKPTPEVI